MKRFIAKIFLFFLIIALVDFGLGRVFASLPKHAKGGDTLNAYTISDLLEDDLLVFGSSRAVHHYDPQILADSTRLSTYNCGLDGNGIIYNYGMFSMLARRHTPRLIIYEITPSFDLYDVAHVPNERYIGPLRPYYDREGIAQIFSDVSSTERIKMLSSMYRYNKRFVPMLSDVLVAQPNPLKGYKPMDGAMDYTKAEEPAPEKPVIDSLKIRYLEKLAADCKSRGISLIFVVSPEYGTQKTPGIDIVQKIGARYGAQFWDYRNDPEISLDSTLFKDSAHLNRDGATLYSRKIGKRLRSTLAE